jgi:hypothetical protein
MSVVVVVSQLLKNQVPNIETETRTLCTPNDISII